MLRLQLAEPRLRVAPPPRLVVELRLLGAQRARRGRTTITSSPHHYHRQPTPLLHLLGVQRARRGRVMPRLVVARRRGPSGQPCEQTEQEAPAGVQLLLLRSVALASVGDELTKRFALFWDQSSFFSAVPPSTGLAVAAQKRCKKKGRCLGDEPAELIALARRGRRANGLRRRLRGGERFGQPLGLRPLG